ncbi:MAG: cohesin domain-containing protein [Candidatus Uhrbacteria bacterium]
MISRFLFALVIGLFSPMMVFAASAAVSGPTEVHVGQTFQIHLNANNAQDIDTIRYIGSYSSELVQVQNMTNGSAFPLRSPGSSVSRDSFNLGGFSLEDTANGDIEAGTLTFKALKPGLATFTLKEGTHIVSNGQEQATSFGSWTVAVSPNAPSNSITIASSSHPDETAWYSAREVRVNWSISGNKPLSTSISFDQNQHSGSNMKLTKNSQANFSANRDGIWYAHIQSRISSSQIIREDFRIQIDTTSPRALTLMNDEAMATQSNTIRFTALDQTSGISHYDVSVNGNFPIATTETFLTVANVHTGINHVRVRATDKAGNSSETELSFQLI